MLTHPQPCHIQWIMGPKYATMYYIVVSELVLWIARTAGSRRVAPAGRLGTSRPPPPPISWPEEGEGVGARGEHGGRWWRARACSTQEEGGRAGGPAVGQGRGGLLGARRCATSGWYRLRPPLPRPLPLPRRLRHRGRSESHPFSLQLRLLHWLVCALVCPEVRGSTYCAFGIPGCLDEHHRNQVGVLLSPYGDFRISAVQMKMILVRKSTVSHRVFWSHSRTSYWISPALIFFLLLFKIFFLIHWEHNFLVYVRLKDCRGTIFGALFL